MGQNRTPEIHIFHDLHPEDCAMLQALYSRSPASVVDHLDKVLAAGSGKFMERYYVGYGHASIGDCGVTTLFIENYSMLAAKAIQDNPLYSGQEASTRYLDFAQQPMIDPYNHPASSAIQQGWMQPEIPRKRTGKRVAIIGSGPAGLAAAHQLNRVGQLVTVFERNMSIGGLLRFGIPSMKLSKEVVQRRVDLMEREGIEFRTHIEVGKNLEVNRLFVEYDALLLATGATWPRDLKIPGRELNGI